MATRQNLTARFLWKMRFLRKYILDTILYKVSMACTKIRMQNLPKRQKYKHKTLSCQFVLKHFFFVFPVHYINVYFRHKVHMLHIEKFYIQCYILNYLMELKKQ